jgi:hypothetical protein
MAIVYRVYGKKTSDSGAEQVMKDNITEKSVVVDGLDPSTEYQLTVSARDGASESVNNPSVTAATATIPGKPTATVTAGDGKGDYTITAPDDDGGSPITGYVYRLKKTSDAGWGDPVNVGTKLTGTISGLENGAEYSIEFAAMNAAGQSPWDDSLAVHFTPSVAVTGITLNKTTDSIAVGANDTLTATISPSNASDKAVEWSSSDETKATVDGSGKVTGVAEGTATITAKAHGDETKTATCAVTITAAG